VLNPWAGFAAGWMFLATKIAAAGTVALGLAGYLESMIPGINPRVVAVAAIAERWKLPRSSSLPTHCRDRRSNRDAAKQRGSGFIHDPGLLRDSQTQPRSECRARQSCTATAFPSSDSRAALYSRSR